MSDLQTNLINATTAMNALTQEVANKIGSINTTVSDKIAEMEAWKNTHVVNDHGCMRSNANATFDAVTNPLALPDGWGVGSSWIYDNFDISYITVYNGVDPASRPAIAKELLEYITPGLSSQQHFGFGFKILKLKAKATITRPASPSYAFYIRDQHSPGTANQTFVCYSKFIGNATVNWLDKVNNQWTFTKRKTGPGFGYTHIDMYFGSVSPGDEIYIALPQLVYGTINDHIFIAPYVQLMYEPFGVGLGWANGSTSTGYQILQSGLILQWGSLNVPGDSNGALITLPTTFPQGPLNWTASWSSSNQQTSSAIYSGYFPNNSSLKLYVSAPGGYGTYWSAIGY